MRRSAFLIGQCFFFLSTLSAIPADRTATQHSTIVDAPEPATCFVVGGGLIGLSMTARWWGKRAKRAEIRNATSAD